MSNSTLSLSGSAITEFRRVLLQTKKHCENSEETGYSHLTANEVTNLLATAVSCLDEGRRPDFDMLTNLYAPTCSLQDIAFDNGWGEEFLSLAEAYDRASRQKD